MVVYETERLLIRPWTHNESDLDRIFDTYSRWEVARWLGSVPKALETRDQVPAVVDRWAARSDEDGRFVLLVPLPDPEGSGSGEVEVGWHFHPDSWGHGVRDGGGPGCDRQRLRGRIE